MKILRVILLSSIIIGLVYFRYYLAAAFVIPITGWYLADLCIGKEFRW